MTNNIIYCSNCGKENTTQRNSCISCGEILRNNKTFSENKVFNDLNHVLTLENKNILENNILTTEAYNLILENIHEIGDFNYNTNLAITPLEKILRIAQSYAPCAYKSKGEELGSYGFNVIFVDDRLDDSQQIATLIHELAHHLLAEIFEQILMYLWEVKKSPALEAFVWFSLTNFENMLIMNEYCAHTVEGRFIPHGYQNYGSFNRLLEQSKLKPDDVIFSLVYGNTIADDLINILEKFIDSDLREEIKLQYKRDLNQPSYDQIFMEQKDNLDDEIKNSSIMDSLKIVLNLSLENQDMKNQLEEYEKIFKSFYEQIPSN